jgi:O-acetyl-ADP-ribose deacetylase (regulator of RNase III)
MRGFYRKKMKYEYNGTRVEAIFGKIEELGFDAIAIPATPSLRMDSGISVKIRDAAGQMVEDEALSQAPGRLGDAIVTGSGDLPSKKIFHCVMLDTIKNASPDSLRRSIKSVFEKAEKLGLEKLAFPAIGASFPGLDPKIATAIIVEESKKIISEKEGLFSVLCFIACDSAPYVYFKKALKKYFKK